MSGAGRSGDDVSRLMLSRDSEAALRWQMEAASNVLTNGPFEISIAEGSQPRAEIDDPVVR